MTDTDKLEAIKEWNDHATTLVGVGQDLKDLSELKSAVASAKKLGKIAGALGVAGVGIDIVLSFMDTGPSIEEEILDGITDLSGKVGGLWHAIDTQFLDSTNHRELNAAKIQINPALALGRQMRRLMADYQLEMHAKDKFQLGLFEDQFRKHFDLVTIRGMLDEISDQAQGNVTGTSLFEAAYAYSKGNILDITAIGLELVQLFTAGIAALGIWERLEWEKAHPGETMPKEETNRILSGINDQYGDAFISVTDAFGDWTQRCEMEVEKNIKLMMTSLFTVTPITAQNRASYIGALKLIIDKNLRPQWPWLMFGGIIYDDRGPDTDGTAYTGDQHLPFISQAFKGGVKATIHIQWRIRHTPTSVNNPDVLDKIDKFQKASNIHPQDWIKQVEASPAFPKWAFILWVARVVNPVYASFNKIIYKPDANHPWNYVFYLD